MESTVIANPSKDPLGFELTLTKALCSVIDSARALSVSLLIDNEEWDQLAHMGIDSLSYQDVGNFADDYLVSKILSKSVNLPLGVDRKEAAIRSFYSAESTCKETNERLLGGPKPHWWRAFQKNLRRILGPHQLAAQAMPELLRIGSGACIGVRGDGLVGSDKFDLPMSIYPKLVPYYEAIVGETVAEYRPLRSCKVVRANRFFSVSKNSETERGACTEAAVAVMYQLSLGEYLVSRLKMFGVDLSSQAWNQALAQMAVAWRLATLDLSQASDTMAWGLLLEGLPVEWFHLLDLGRADYTEMPDGTFVELEKFCSMGNGFTFPLETVVFLALIQTFVPQKERCLTAVYGDDIIVPQRYAAALIDALEFSGFSVNTKKSFLAGNFFESCGHDFFNGVNVRPFFLRSEPDEHVPYAVGVTNALRLWSNRRNHGYNCDQRFRKVWLELKDLCPWFWAKCRVPSTMGDVGLYGSHKEIRAHSTRRSLAKSDKAVQFCGWEGVLVKSVSMVPDTKDKKTFGIVLAGLIGKRTPEYTARSRRSLNWLFPDVADFTTYGLEPKRGYLRLVCTCKTWVSDLGQDLAWC